MTSNILHITNGDCTTDQLQKISIPGTLITWREMLCEGKTEVGVGDENFWKNRFEFLKTNFKVSKQQFIDKTLKEYRRLCNQQKQDEIVLWFDSDLFCQINMIAVISWLKRYRKGRKISLVSCTSEEIPANRFGFSALTNDQVLEHYKSRTVLTEDDIAYADYVWQLYCADNPLKIEMAKTYQTNTTFKHLNTSLITHLKRFPSIENGLNAVENTILTAVSKQKFSSKDQLVKKLLSEQEVYGFGDLQYHKYLMDLKDYLRFSKSVSLTDTGKKVQQNLLHSYANMRNDFSFLGGAKKYNFLYDNSTNKLLKITTL
ncbi:hypothetical protein GCM10011416_22990 [Polaribacter pacificus]|uniref:DUF1835 domain-containing protein n=1 Tax=Polaribacter pacificus TaxID=1775173 RepID=A0A917I1G0_9FLAO|nr:DUF1835 domain-containing protein [Polaribacter pacificus]GGH03466.1 hypothetical protein GCM10011416_22990 [Polaribacter pacificus]